MFFVMGITSGEKKLEYDSGMCVCKSCGAYCRFEVIMTYMCLSLFFIPIFKWGKKYYAASSCCRQVFEIDAKKGKAIENGESVLLEDGDFISSCGTGDGLKVCQNCRYVAESDFEFCPKCGTKL